MQTARDIAAPAGTKGSGPDIYTSSSSSASQAAVCPVGFGSSPASTANQASTAKQVVSTDQPAAAACPYGFGAAQTPEQAADKHPTGCSASEGTDKPAGGCPMGFGAAQTPDKAAGSCPMGYGQAPQQSDKPAAKCPMGYGQADGPQLSQFHCTLCKSLLFNCVVLSCSHRFCGDCVARFNDCPVCGADIDSRAPDKELQGKLLLWWQESMDVVTEVSPPMRR